MTLISETDAAAKALARATLSGKPSKTTAALKGRLADKIPLFIKSVWYLINYCLIVLAKEQKDEELTKATALGEQEIRRFHQQRLSEMKVS